VAGEHHEEISQLALVSGAGLKGCVPLGNAHAPVW
jgi:hypothetical protein